MIDNLFYYIRKISLFLVTVFLTSFFLSQAAVAAGGTVKVEVLGHYTDDKEWFGEEWTFGVKARFVRDNGDSGEGLPRQKIWSGDSNPDNNDWHDLEDYTVFERSFLLELPASIEIHQRGWENDLDPRRVYQCCKWWRNDDDDYGTGTESIDLASLPNDTWQEFDLPDLKSNHGIKFRIKVQRVPSIRSVVPDKGCKRLTNIPVSVNGTGFVDGMEVKIGGLGVTVHDVAFVSDNRIDTLVDIGAGASPTARRVTVSMPGQAVLRASLNNAFRVLSLVSDECKELVRPPIIKSVKPSIGCRGQSNQAVTVRGAHFLEGMKVEINGLGVTTHDAVVNSADMISVQVDTGGLAPLSARDVEVSMPGVPFLQDITEDAYTVHRSSDEECQTQ